MQKHVILSNFVTRSQTRRRWAGFLPLPLAAGGFLLLLLAISPPQTLADDPIFATHHPFGTGSDSTWSVAVGDMDGDGDLDVVVGNNSVITHGGVVYLNDGGIQGGTPSHFSIGHDFVLPGSWVEDMAVGDMDGDGDLDIVTSYADRGKIYLNDGGDQGGTPGHFSTERSFAAPPDRWARSVAVGDMDGDGDFDIVAGNYERQGLVFLNSVTATFPLTSSFGTGAERTYSVAVGDVDGDGDLDIVTGNYGQTNVVYLNDGGIQGGTPGHFSATVSFGTGADETYSVAVGDVDSDGNLDIVTGNYSQTNVVYLNDGLQPPSFSVGHSLGTEVDPTQSVAMGDVDGDGCLDVVVGNGKTGGWWYVEQQNLVYLNDGAGQFSSGLGFGTETDRTYAVAMGDLDGDGHLDVVAGNLGQQNMVYLNDGAGHLPPGYDLGTDAEATLSIAVGDVDSDGDLDVVGGLFEMQNVIRLNNGDLNGDGVWDGTFARRDFGDDWGDTTYSVAVGDLDGDGHLDIVVGNGDWPSGEQNTIYLNDGTGDFYAGPVSCATPPTRTLCFGTGMDATSSVAVGDMDGDGDLDVVAGNQGQQNTVYLNDGLDPPSFSEGRNFGTGTDWPSSIALGDMDGDSDLDIVTANSDQSVVYLNDGAGNFPIGQSFDAGQYVAVGDVDGDSDLDVVVGNSSRQNVIHLNDGQNPPSFSLTRSFGSGTDGTSSIAMGDMDGDGDLDIITGNGDWGYSEQNVIYLNDGMGHFSIGWDFGTGQDQTSSVAVGDVDSDGDLDALAGNIDQRDTVCLNQSAMAAWPTNRSPAVAIARPDHTHDAAFFSTPAILGSQAIPITYTLIDPENGPVRFVRAFYSPDGGGRWLPAVATSSTITISLGTSPWPTGTAHLYVWDTFASGFYGRSDDVVFRIEAYSDLHPRVNSASGLYLRPFASATTFPFRVRGTQVRVYSGIVAPGNEAAGAIVYRLPGSQSRGAEPLGGAENPFRTDVHGYLQGHGRLDVDDQLVALLPITATDSYTLYYTSATPTPNGLNAYTVGAFGVQTLTVSSADPLILFNLDVSLEWDARADEAFVSQLEFDLLRASEILYDWTNGRAALGQVRIYHDRERWLDAHVRVYSSNRLRPSAAQGGIASAVITDQANSDIVYGPGQVYMGATWNRYGDAGSSLGEDWPRTLAHELGHYAFFLDDNYLGLDEGGLLIPVEGCPGAMSDPYREDYPYDEFHSQDGWLPACEWTLSHQNTGRSDWETIATFYHWLSGTAAITNTGPSMLPLAVTRIQAVEPITPSLALESPAFYLSQDGSRIQPGRSARVFLFQDDAGSGSRWLTDLGRPRLDQVLARGAQPGDRVCVYETAAARLGCETIAAGDDQLALESVMDWQPEVIVSPVTSRTIGITVTNVSAGLSLGAQLFPVSDPATDPISLTETAGGYMGVFHTVEPALEGYVHAWVYEAAPRREIVTDYALGGNPGHMLGGYGGIRGRPGHMLGGYAPAISTDGQVILFGNMDFDPGEFVALQAATVIPSPLPWATVVGQAYRLSTSAGAPDLSGASISFGYIGSEVPPGEETWLRVYFWDGLSWEQLPTHLDTYRNITSAVVQGEGVYALMSSVEIPLYGPGWNMFAYPVQATRPVTEALVSLSGVYTTVYGYEATDIADPWKIYDVTVPDWVNDLEALEFGRGYWIQVSETITLMLKGDSTSAAAVLSSLQAPPATYYGHVAAGSGFAPAAGMEVTAWVDGHLCGQGETLEEDGQVVYSVNVLADGPGGSAGCGVLGREVAFRVGSQDMIPTAVWDNNRVWELELRPIGRIYLPLVLKGP
jgi:hypothetical protein